MRKKILASLFCILITFTATFAWADIRSEIRSQHHRIRQGIRSGELTRKEAGFLEDKLVHIEREYRIALRGDRISPYEEDRLYRELENNSRKIHRLKNNNNQRY